LSAGRHGRRPAFVEPYELQQSQVSQQQHASQQQHDAIAAGETVRSGMVSASTRRIPVILYLHELKRRSLGLSAFANQIRRFSTRTGRRRSGGAAPDLRRHAIAAHGCRRVSHDVGGGISGRSTGLMSPRVVSRSMQQTQLIARAAGAQ